jgi:ribonuclease P protein subunit POP4
MITPENLPMHELIGLKVRVAKSVSLPHKGIEGVVVDETKNTLVVLSKGKEKVVPKKGSTFKFTLPSGAKAEIVGDRINFRPFDRVKKVKLNDD